MDVAARNTAIKWAAGIIGVPVLALAIYLGAVLQVYVLAFVVHIIGIIF
jgi:hypothetical protein